MKGVKRELMYFKQKREEELSSFFVTLNGSCINLQGQLPGASDGDYSYSLNLERYSKTFNDGRYLYGVTHSGQVESLQTAHPVLKGLPDSVNSQIIQALKLYNKKLKKQALLLELVKANPFFKEEEILLKVEEVFAAMEKVS